MGKNQKMKKAALAAATAAAKAAAASPLPAAVTESSCTEKAKSDEDNMRSNMDMLMNLAEKLQTDDAGKAQPDLTFDSSDSDDAAEVAHSDVPKQKRGEKKARRLLMKLDLKHIPDVSRVIMRKAKNVLICIDHPDVYRCPHTKTIICFGEVRIEDTSNTATAQAAERYLNDVNARASQQVNDGDNLTLTNEDELDEEKEDGSMLDEKDIELVIMQSNCSRQKAIKALLKHKSDVVNAIMELTVD